MYESSFQVKPTHLFASSNPLSSERCCLPDIAWDFLASQWICLDYCYTSCTCLLHGLPPTLINMEYLIEGFHDTLHFNLTAFWIIRRGRICWQVLIFQLSFLAKVIQDSRNNLFWLSIFNHFISLSKGMGNWGLWERQDLLVWAHWRSRTPLQAS